MKNIDILFLDGLVPKISKYPSFIGFAFTIGSVLKMNNYTFKIFNCSLLEDYCIDEILNELSKLKFSTIGISTHAENIRWVYKVVNRIKVRFPHIPIILGGPQVSFSDLKSIGRCNCDVIVRHEGEYTLIKLLDYYIKNIGNLADINGITYRDNLNIISNKDAQLIDLDELPVPLYEIFNEKEYWHIPNTVTEKHFKEFQSAVRAINNAFLTSRGCPYSCIFCVEGTLKNKHRERNTRNVILDLEHYIKNIKLKNIVIADDTFTSNKKRVIEICEKLTNLRKEYDFVWFAEARVNVLANNPELLNIMMDAGLYSLQIGIESGVQEVLNAQNKMISLDQIRTVAKQIGDLSLKDKIITLSGNFILGGPGETKETLQGTLDFAKELLILANYQLELKYCFLVPFEGTPLRINPEAYNLIICDNDFEMSKMQFFEILCYSNRLTKSEVSNAYFNFGKVLTETTYENMFKLSKVDIDNRIRKDKEFSKKYQPTFLSSLIRTYYSLYLLHGYYELHEQDCTVKNMRLKEVSSLCPLAIWDLYFDLNTDSFRFYTFDGQLIKIENDHKYLWESADGRKTLKEIVNEENSPYRNNIDAEVKAFTFYEMMYEKFALIFREY